MLLNWIKNLFSSRPAEPAFVWQPQWTIILQSTVAFYRALSQDDKLVFEQRCLLFLNTTRIEAGAFEVTDEDRLLVAASAVIPVWGFPNWHYFNLAAVFLLPGAFNEKFECSMPDSYITGMVGTGPMAGKMAISRPHLHLGYKNSRDKQNVGIHEFVHLVDMMDGVCDGVPERLHKFDSIATWFDFVEHKIGQIAEGKSNIRDYGATNRQEFFAVASEYFFERPEMLKKKHPALFDKLVAFYQQNTLEIAKDIKVRRKSPCPCGSGKRYKHCCMPA